jgi:hypothetical protein
VHETLVGALAEEHERVAARADVPEAGLLVDADGARVGGSTVSMTFCRPRMWK